MENVKRLDLVDDWLNLVAYSHSQSKATYEQYKRVWAKFSAFMSKSADDTKEDYDASDDRTFKTKYAQYVRAWIAQLAKEGLTNTSIKTYVGIISSFFHYNDMPLGLIPQAQSGIVFHNRDITKEEIIQIMALTKIREKAFFAVMAQSGLRPHTIAQLKLKNLESFDKIQCKIEVPKEITKGKFGSYVTFIGPEAIKYVKQYLSTRTNPATDSLLFCAHDDPRKPVSVKDMSRAFRLAARKLEQSGAIDFEVRQGKPSELRFYSLRKFFRKQAHQMGFENVNYLMGHVVRGSDANYRPQDPEFYRKLYVEKALPFLRLETATPIESEKQIEELRQQISQKDEEIQGLKQNMTKLQPLIEFVNGFQDPNALKLFLDLLKTSERIDFPDHGTFMKIDLPEEMSKRIDAIAAERGITRQEAIDWIIDKGMDKEEQELKKQSHRK